jgi:hypothetical protein
MKILCACLVLWLACHILNQWQRHLRSYPVRTNLPLVCFGLAAAVLLVA